MTTPVNDHVKGLIDQFNRTPTWVLAAMGAAGAVGGYWAATVLMRNKGRRESTVSTEAAGRAVTFNEVGGHDDLKRQIEKRIILPFREPLLFERFRKRAGGGILMYGPPGCGKTLLARATAGQCNARFFSAATSDVLDMWLGESERRLAAIFAKARAASPAVLFFDELDGLAANHHRETSHSSIISQFLSEMDGFAKRNRGLLILGATNVPWSIDTAFRRPGRFDRVLFVPPPDRAARVAIMKIQLSGRPTAADVDLGWIAERTAGFSGADLELLIEEATDAAIAASIEAGSDVPVRNDHLRAALKPLKPTTREWFAMARDHARLVKGTGLYDDMLRYLEANGLEG